MGVENIMYLALGLLIAGLGALMIMPAIWRRAVRLTKKRMQAATPITMAEFRADKDQLRAEFALTTRRLEMTVEALRTRLAEQLRETNQHRSDLATATAERDTHVSIIGELEARARDLRQRVVDLERESADLALKLRASERDVGEKVQELEAARQALRESVPTPAEFEGSRLSGNYTVDVERLIGVIGIERNRMRFLEDQNRTLIAQLEGTSRSAEAVAAADEVRRAIATRAGSDAGARAELIAAEAHMAEAESRLNVVLAETARIVADGESRPEKLLADKLSLEEQLSYLRAKIEGVESTLLADLPEEPAERSSLRERLSDIASDVARLVYVADGREPADTGESLAAVVQRFADGKTVELPVRAAIRTRQGGSRPVQGGSAVPERLVALRDVHTTN